MTVVGHFPPRLGLSAPQILPQRLGQPLRPFLVALAHGSELGPQARLPQAALTLHCLPGHSAARPSDIVAVRAMLPDRKSAVEGKGWSVRFGPGCRRLLKQKKK